MTIPAPVISEAHDLPSNETNKLTNESTNKCCMQATTKMQSNRLTERFSITHQTPTTPTTREVIKEAGQETYAFEALRASVDEFLARLDMACSVGSTEGNVRSNEKAYIARKHAVSVICNAVMKPAGTRTNVIEACAEIRAKHTPMEREDYQRKLERHLGGLDILAVCAACFHRIGDDEKHDILDKNRDLIMMIFSDPTDALEASFVVHGLNMMVFRSIMQHNGSSARKMVDMLTQYFTTNRTASRLHDACVDAASIIREEMAIHDRTNKWSSVSVGLGSADNDGFTLKYPSYASDTLELNISCNFSKRGLRVSTFVDALEQCAELGVFPPHHSCEGSCKLLKTTNIGHVGKRLEKDKEWSGPSETLIPAVLKRDFHVLSAIEASVPTDGGVLRPTDISNVAMSSTDFFELEACGNRSLEQVSNYILRKCAFDINRNNGCQCGVEYVKSDNPAVTVGHVRLDAGGSARLLLHVRNLLSCIGSNDCDLSSQWRPSRSSRKMAFKKCS